MTNKKPFDKEHSTKISFSELVELIGTNCDYKFCIIDENIDDELLELAAKHKIGDTYYYVEEVRMKNKSLAFKSLRKRQPKSPS